MGSEPIVRGEPVEVAEGVFVIPDGRVPLVPNVGIVVGERAALVVDTGLGPRSGAYVLDQARRLAGDRPLYLTTTHFHPEHGFGAQVFEGVATVVYNRAQRDELHRKGAAYLDMFAGLGPEIAAELADVRLVGPDIAYDGDRVELDLGGRTAVLHHRGPAHSAGDQTVLVDDRVLFTGDLVETRMFPIVPHFPPFDVDADAERWIAVLDRLRALDPAVVVPGHGEVGDAALIGDVRDYLDHVRTEVTRLAADGKSFDEVSAEIGRTAREGRSTWEQPEWIGFTARAFHESA
ncbi:MBL fold metallo-hydrolase [Actinosynnema sp. NPDC047251]|uniref:Beta-lactamase domain protein n=1 Tax=Saccharothrix espanaensis (strain ATCC 51144 / DSM 44229 / JCM 9112 / NBRC 15066 / NRRL 15764) TaxID=1179773 RepID=K0K3Q8_SACES|nr:MBL fold metallo-hydrolase [Saccharothrix espanaensis]CCH31158.1 beta-lactamase domain protein [Saccharothrix espanaensis DSM 44229]